MSSKNWFGLILLLAAVICTIQFVSAYYVNDIYFTLPDTVYTTNERMEIKGYVYQANYTTNGTLVSSSSPVSNAIVNITIRNSTTTYNTTNLTTNTNGTFYSKSDFYSSALEIRTPVNAGTYYIKASYTDPNNNTAYSETEIYIVNQSMDILRVSSEKAEYNPSESIKLEIEAIKVINDKTTYIANITVNGSIRNAAKTVLSAFTCTTGSNGRCYVTATAPNNYGDYVIELNNFKVFNSFSIVPFSSGVYMKDEFGQSSKNVFAMGEQARIEVQIYNASSTDSYSYSGYIADSDGNVVKTINSTELNQSDSFTKSTLLTIDALTFNYGAYTAYLTILKTGDGNVTTSASFQVKDWSLAINKKSASSGFEYGYSVFSTKTMRFEATPTYRSNGSVISGINSTFFTINLKDNLNNIIASTNANWNASCGKEGCYEFSLTSPSEIAKYYVYVTLSYGNDLQTESRTIDIISDVLTVQSTDSEGNLKELFGTNEYIYLSLSAYNLTLSQFNMTDAEIFSIIYMNSSEFSYSEVNNFSAVNSSNTIYEWAWNSSLQRLKIDAPKAGGIYTALILAKNRTVGAVAKFVINPYDACVAAKDTAGQVSGNYYYVWQFKTTDTVYFEIKITQANNPLGRATASNSSSSSSNGSTTGMGAQCTVDTQTKQVVTNATLTVLEVKNLESGAAQDVNTTESICQASDNSGTYSCTLKPLSKWEGGQNIAKLNIKGQDGTTNTVYGRFEARAFYLYGWSSAWQNSPSSNITLNVQMYEAGRSWWGGGGTGWISGTVTVKKVEYQGKDGEWLWPPVDSGYNVSTLNSSSITSSTGSISLPVANAKNGTWKTGYYRVILQATTSSGDTDYGYAWFGVKLWDVYGQPVECASDRCNYKNYFNSKDNITLFVKISKAGNYNYNDQGGQPIWGNVTIKVKSIQNCKTWPCADLNTSLYSASRTTVNTSSPWYWNANLSDHYNYTITINRTSGTWSTGYYSVILDINGTDTGNAWFNTIAFYIEAQPTNSTGLGYKYSIRGNSPIYFNVSSVKSDKTGYWYDGAYIKYNTSDYINTTISDITLRTWDQQTWQSKELNYPEDINVTPTNITGNRVLNITYINKTWPTGYYWGELILRNSEGETSTGWLWFNVQPFRVQINTNNYNVDSDQCINSTIYIYESDWSSYTPLWGNYSIISVYENNWGYHGSSKTEYTNYTSSSFNATSNLTFCPNSGSWGSGSWGGYHYLNIIIRDDIANDTQTGWLSFRAVPFQITWGSIVNGTSKMTTENINVSVTITKPSTGANATGNLTRLYQWRYDNYVSTKQEYAFRVGNCYSAVSGSCTINGTQNITVYAPSGGWRVGYNYIQSEWTSSNDATSLVQDWSGIYLEGKEAYNGYYSNSDINNYWKYNFAVNENITIKLFVRDSNYNPADITITSVQYASPQSNCWSESCRSYATATFSPTATSGGNAILNIKVPSANWTKGEYYIKATVSGSGGTATILGGTVRVKDMTAPNITIVAPVNNATYNYSLLFNATTTENSQCNINLVNYNNFYNWYCNNYWNATNSSNQTIAVTAQILGACNFTKYNYDGSTHYSEGLSNNYRSTYDGNYSTWEQGSFITTGTTNHHYAINTTNLTNQHYGISIWCYDEDYNYASSIVAFKINNTI